MTPGMERFKDWKFIHSQSTGGIKNKSRESRKNEKWYEVQEKMFSQAGKTPALTQRFVHIFFYLRSYGSGELFFKLFTSNSDYVNFKP